MATYRGRRQRRSGTPCFIRPPGETLSSSVGVSVSTEGNLNEPSPFDRRASRVLVVDEQRKRVVRQSRDNPRKPLPAPKTVGGSQAHGYLLRSSVLVGVTIRSCPRTRQANASCLRTMRWAILLRGCRRWHCVLNQQAPPLQDETALTASIVI